MNSQTMRFCGRENGVFDVFEVEFLSEISDFEDQSVWPVFHGELDLVARFAVVSMTDRIGTSFTNRCYDFMANFLGKRRLPQKKTNMLTDGAEFLRIALNDDSFFGYFGAR